MGDAIDITVAYAGLQVDVTDKIDRLRCPRIWNPKTGTHHFKMETEWQLKFEYPLTTAVIIIPRDGVFPDSDSLGEDPIRVPAYLHSPGAFHVAANVACSIPDGSSRMMNGTEIILDPDTENVIGQCSEDADRRIVRGKVFQPVKRNCGACRTAHTKCNRDRANVSCSRWHNTRRERTITLGACRRTRV